MNLEALRFLSYYRIRKSRALAVTPPPLFERQHGRRHEECRLLLLPLHRIHTEVRRRRHGK